MKRSLLFLVLVSFSIDTVAGVQHRKIDEEAWQKAKEVLLSGEVAYSLLGVVLMSLVMRRCWVLWEHRRAHDGMVKHRQELMKHGAEFAKIFTENLDPKVMEQEAENFLQKNLNFKQTKEEKKISCEYNKEQGLLSIKVIKPELRKSPRLTLFYSMLQAARINNTDKNEMVLGESTRLLDDEDVILEMTVVI